VHFQRVDASEGFNLLRDRLMPSQGTTRVSSVSVPPGRFMSMLRSTFSGEVSERAVLRCRNAANDRVRSQAWRPPKNAPSRRVQPGATKPEVSQIRSDRCTTSRGNSGALSPHRHDNKEKKRPACDRQRRAYRRSHSTDAVPMATEDRRSNTERHSNKDRRSGVDARTEDPKKRLGEPRSGSDPTIRHPGNAASRNRSSACLAARPAAMAPPDIGADERGPHPPISTMGGNRDDRG
jgi:hypothetical protein